MPKCEKLPSGHWRIRVRNQNESHSITAPTRAECEYLYAQYMTEKKAKPVKKTVRQAIEEYIELTKPVLKETTIAGYETILKSGFPSIMDMQIDKLDDIAMQKAINEECQRKNTRNGKTLSPKTVKNEWGLIVTALRLIAHKTYVVRLPETPKKLKTLPNPLDILEAFRGTEIELPVLLAMWCGLRASEIYGLTYGSIEGDYLLIDKTRVTVNKKRILRHTAKTDTSIRRVKLPPYIRGLIAPNSNENDFIVELSHSQVYTRYKTIIEKNNLDITFHDLRHEFATVSLSILGLPPKEVQMAGGWKTKACMDKIYSNMISSVREEADNKRDNYFNSLIE